MVFWTRTSLDTQCNSPLNFHIIKWSLLSTVYRWLTSCKLPPEIDPTLESSLRTIILSQVMTEQTYAYHFQFTESAWSQCMKSTIINRHYQCANESLVNPCQILSSPFTSRLHTGPIYSISVHNDSVSLSYSRTSSDSIIKDSQNRSIHILDWIDGSFVCAPNKDPRHFINKDFFFLWTWCKPRSSCHGAMLSYQHCYHVYIRYVLAFFIIVFLPGFFVYFLPPVHIYIRALDPQMNTSDIHNMVYRAGF
jgi:hypothetical protein